MVRLFCFGVFLVGERMNDLFVGVFGECPNFFSSHFINWFGWTQIDALIWIIFIHYFSSSFPALPPNFRRLVTFYGLGPSSRLDDYFLSIPQLHQVSEVFVWREWRT